MYAKQYDDYELEVLELLRKVRTWSVREQREAKHEGAARVAKNDNITRRFICAEDDDSLAFEIDGDAVGWEHRARNRLPPCPPALKPDPEAMLAGSWAEAGVHLMLISHPCSLAPSLARSPDFAGTQASIDDLDLEELLPPLASPAAGSGFGSEANTPYPHHGSPDHDMGGARGALMPYAGPRSFASPPHASSGGRAAIAFPGSARVPMEPAGMRQDDDALSPAGTPPLGTAAEAAAAAEAEEHRMRHLLLSVAHGGSPDGVPHARAAGGMDAADPMHGGGGGGGGGEDFEEGFGALEEADAGFGIDSRTRFGASLGTLLGDAEDVLAEEAMAEDGGEGGMAEEEEGAHVSPAPSMSHGAAAGARSSPHAGSPASSLQDELDELDEPAPHPGAGQGDGEEGARGRKRPMAANEGGRAANGEGGRPRVRPRRVAPPKPMVVDDELQLPKEALQTRMRGPPEGRSVHVAILNAHHHALDSEADELASPASSSSSSSSSRSLQRGATDGSPAGSDPPSRDSARRLPLPSAGLRAHSYEGPARLIQLAPRVPAKVDRPFFYREHKRMLSQAVRGFSDLDDAWKVHRALQADPPHSLSEAAGREHALRAFPLCLSGGGASANLLQAWVRLLSGAEDLPPTAGPKRVRTEAARDVAEGAAASGGHGQGAEEDEAEREFDEQGYGSGEGEGTPELFRNNPSVHDIEDGAVPAIEGGALGGEAGHAARVPRWRRSSALAARSSLGVFAFDEADWEATNDVGAFEAEEAEEEEASAGAEPLAEGAREDGGDAGVGGRARVRRSSAWHGAPEVEAEFDLDAIAWQPREPSVGGSDEEDASEDAGSDDVDDEGIARERSAHARSHAAGGAFEARGPVQRASTYARGPQKLFAFLQRMLPDGEAEIDYVDDFLRLQLTKRKSRASAFGQLLTLVSDDLLAIEQAEPYGALKVRRGEAFDAAVPEVPGVAATIAEEDGDEDGDEDGEEDGGRGGNAGNEDAIERNPEGAANTEGAARMEVDEDDEEARAQLLANGANAQATVA